MSKKSVEIFDKMMDSIIENPEIMPERIVVLSLSKEKMSEILTPARIELIKIIKENRPESVGELVKITKRPIESISRDLRILANYGILEFVQVGKIKKPRIEKDMILIPLTA